MPKNVLLPALVCWGKGLTVCICTIRKASFSTPNTQIFSTWKPSEILSNTMSHTLAPIAGSNEDKVVIRRALISVSDKSGVVDLCNVLRGFGVDLLSTGGTAETIRNAGIPVTDVSKYTGFPEILDGRVKTLHPKIYGALLAVRGNPKHEAECDQNGIGAIDLIVMNLYPFEKTVASGADFGTSIENIDIGGPAMLRSSAKNHQYITILTSPSQYEAFIEKLRSSAHMVSGEGIVTTTLQMRRQYAAAAFQLSAQYDAAIASYFTHQVEQDQGVRKGDNSGIQEEPVSQSKASEQSAAHAAAHIDSLTGTDQTPQEELEKMDVCSQGTAGDSETEGQDQAGGAGPATTTTDTVTPTIPTATTTTTPTGTTTGTVTPTTTTMTTTTAAATDATTTTSDAPTTTHGLISTHTEKHSPAHGPDAAPTTFTTQSTELPEPTWTEKSTSATIPATAFSPVTRTYHLALMLKYGLNPHQTPASVYTIGDTALPFTVLHGVPGYINLLDALYGWQLVSELSKAMQGAPAAASFKHCSPAGAALGIVPLSAAEARAYEVPDAEALTPLALAYVRARNADPMCSFGDFAALSHTVDKHTAQLIKTSICDGIIAPGFEPEALTILQAKKKGAFIVLQADAAFVPPDVEYRELYGVGFSQKRNDIICGEESLRDVVVTGTGLQEGTTGDHSPSTTTSEVLPASAKRDLTLASICIKYAQSNSVGYAVNGQMIGVGAGQQSRVDCVKLAGKKAALWFLRQHPKVQNLPFKKTVKKQDRINARVRYIEGDITPYELPFWQECFETTTIGTTTTGTGTNGSGSVEELSEEEKNQFLGTLQNVALSSDAFFPFRDSIDHASRYGVQYVAQPGGSIADEEVKEACREYGISMAFTHQRLFLH